MRTCNLIGVSRYALRRSVSKTGTSRMIKMTRNVHSSIQSCAPKTAALPDLTLPTYVYEANYSRVGSFLTKYGTNLNKVANEGKLDPVIGRQEEIERAIQILGKRTKNNPILIGEPGVGKTAIVEGIASRIVTGQVPEFMKSKIIISLDLSNMLAGAKLRGEFEERFKSVLRDVERADGMIMLFIDEIHMIVGAGASDGNSFDAGNMIKPALARGELRCIGATTTDEYKKYIEKDAALARRFQNVHVPEPTVNEASEILMGLKGKYEKHHDVEISREAIDAATSMSHRYITDRRLPDKAIDLIDEACSLVGINAGVYAYELQAKEAEGNNDKDVPIDPEDAMAAAEAFPHAAVHEPESEPEAATRVDPNKKPEVSENDIASIISKITRMPVGKLLEQERSDLLDIEKRLSTHVIGQSHALAAIARCIRLSRAGLRHHDRPIGVFLFLGKSGTGKTEAAKALSEVLFNTKDALTRVDMNEYSERIAVSRLVGAPPGYVGYDQGGALTEAVRARPYQVVLLDEFEKADRAVSNMLLQVFDEGSLSDAQGRHIDFRNTILVLTSNIGSTETYLEKNDDTSSIESMPSEDIKKIVQRYLSPELVNRLDDIVVFKSIDRDSIDEICSRQLQRVQHLLNTKGHELTVSTDLKTWLCDEGHSEEFGVRPLKRLIQTTILDPVATAILEGHIEEKDAIIVRRHDENLGNGEKTVRIDREKGICVNVER